MIWQIPNNNIYFKTPGIRTQIYNELKYYQDYLCSGEASRKLLKELQKSKELKKGGQWWANN